jgi:putative acetyltransferase
VPHPNISIDDPRAPDIRELLGRHLAFAHAHTPREAAHALDTNGLLDPALTLYSLRIDGELFGVGAIKQLDASDAELKSMHVAEAARGRGFGRATLEHLIGVARERGLDRLSLETGTMDSFAPARALYVRGGFTPCGPFGSYPPSPHSTFMTMSLVDSRP